VFDWTLKDEITVMDNTGPGLDNHGPVFLESVDNRNIIKF